MGVIETIPFDSAREFLAALRPSEEQWLSPTSWASPWVFRGHRDATWPLTPSAWRPDVLQRDEYKALFKVIEVSDETVKDVCQGMPQDDLATQWIRAVIVQHRFEFAITKFFAHLVDQLGFAIPGGTFPPEADDRVLSYENNLENIHPAFALAQHHRVPTRLLDWTSNPLVAAFFAAEEVNAKRSGELAVWALDTSSLGRDSCIGIYTPPRSEIGYLHAQHGLFTYYKAANLYYIQNGDWPRAENLLPDKCLRKLTLANREAPELYRLLWAERVTKAHLMPSLDNIAAVMKTSWTLYDKKDDGDSRFTPKGEGNA